MKYIPLEKIVVSDLNVRKEIDDEDIKELEDSIKQIGIQQPIVVVEKGDKFEVVIGQRRFRAAKNIGLKEIPAIIREYNDAVELLLASFSENIQRKDLSYNDKMITASKLLGILGTVREVAKKVGMSEGAIRNYLGYAGVPDQVKNLVDSGKIRPTTALRISRSLSDENKIIEVANAVIETGDSATRKKIIDVAKSYPKAKFRDEYIELAKRAQEKSVSFDISEIVWDALKKASTDMHLSQAMIAREALEEWLTGKGYLK